MEASTMERWHMAMTIVIVVLVCSFWGGVIYVGWHFISRYW